jgi:hypothetical protein
MKSEYPHNNFANPDEKKDEVTARPSRFLDEKISDASGTEAQSDSALQPTGLDNPFWN